MAGIPMSALRRALALIAEGADRSVFRANGVPHIDRGIAYGGLPGAVVGGIEGARLDTDDSYPNGAGAGMVLGAFGGAMLGGGVGGLAKLAHMGAAGAGGGFRGLRQALAERAAEQGMGRRAVREVADAEDAATFGATSARQDVPLVEDMRAAGARPFARAPDAMDEMQELTAANRILRRLKQERRAVTDPDEAADLDEQIAELTRLLGG